MMKDTDIVLEGAFREGESAAGASSIREGFTFGHTTDVAFALGFPHARVWSHDDDEPIEPDAVIREPRWRVCWPPSIGRARARVRGVDNVWIDEDGQVTPEEAAVAAQTTEPIAVDEAHDLVRQLFIRIQPFGPREMCLLLEADVGAEAMLSMIADEFDRLPVDRLTEYAPSLFTIAQFVGFALLRVHASEAPVFRECFDAVIQRAPVEGKSNSINGSLDRALNGRAGAERNGLLQGEALHPSSLWFVDDDPSFVRDQILANHHPWEMFAGDSRCAFLGGDEVIRYFVRRWLAVHPMMTTEMLHEFGLIQHPAIVELMVMACDESEYFDTADRWLRKHRSYALPILESLASGTRKGMAKSSATCLARLG